MNEQLSSASPLASLIDSRKEQLGRMAYFHKFITQWATPRLNDSASALEELCSPLSELPSHTRSVNTPSLTLDLSEITPEYSAEINHLDLWKAINAKVIEQQLFLHLYIIGFFRNGDKCVVLLSDSFP